MGCKKLLLLHMGMVGKKGDFCQRLTLILGSQILGRNDPQCMIYF